LFDVIGVGGKTEAVRVCCCWR